MSVVCSFVVSYSHCSVFTFVGAVSYVVIVVFLMIRRPPRSTLDRSSAASDVYKRQLMYGSSFWMVTVKPRACSSLAKEALTMPLPKLEAVSYTHLRAHETVLDLVCRLLLEKKKKTTQKL